VAIAILGAAIVGIGLAWKSTPLAELIQPTRLASQLETLGRAPWGPAAMLALFILGGFAMMPLLVLVTATALVFEPITAILISLTGSLLNAAALYFTGAKLMRGRVEKSFGAPIARVRGSLQGRGVLAVAIVRMLPVAPFWLVNLAGGSIGISFRDFMFGTFLGLAPGIVLLSVFGHELKDLLRDPSLERVLAVVAIALAWVLLSFAIQRFVSRRRPSV
jgi:uncharacterized membrane protein YdjX (TVP38/TMEM64 family)